MADMCHLFLAPPVSHFWGAVQNSSPGFCRVFESWGHLPDAIGGGTLRQFMCEILGVIARHRSFATLPCGVRPTIRSVVNPRHLVVGATI